MTKTAARVTVSPTTSPDGCPAWRIECACSTHPAGMTAAIAIGPVDGQPFPAANVHGTVLLVHHPVLGPAHARQHGTTWKA